jgi:magnesium-protoporphyrin IX monomethyl ester (oxidative) cyclase
MKVLLIKPPLTLQKDFKGIARFFPPIGLGYIASSLKMSGHEVKILDAGIEKWNKINDRGHDVKYLGMSWDDISERIRKENPDIVGISILSVEAVNSSLTAKAVKKANRNIKVIAGGPHVCVRPEQTLKDPNIDFIVLGEGEITTVELVNALEKGSSLKDVKGIWYKKNGRIIKNEPMPLIQDLDSIPFPDWNLINIEKYFRALRYFQGSRSIREKSLGIITSRGCPYACVFCSIRLSMGRGFRSRSPENVIQEIEQLIEKYDVKHIGFEDDNLTFDKNRINKICDLLIEKGLNKKITWGTPNGIRADTLDEPLLRKMKETGCREIIVAPESGSQYVVNNIIGKNLDLRTVENVVRICKKIGIECGCFFVIGLPGETISEIEETLRFANKMRSLGATPFCSIAWPYYGTNLYKIAREKGYLLKKDGEELELSLLNMEAIIKTPEFTPEQLYKYQRMIHGDTEINELFSLIRTRPLDAVRCFSLHPVFITKYLLNKYVKKTNFN